jgi:hypothetical protein
MKMRVKVFLCAAAAIVFAAASAQAQNGDYSGRGNAIITVLPNHAAEQRMNVSQQDIKQIKVDGRGAQATGFRPLAGPNSPVELVFLIDSGARTSLGTQLSEITGFVQEMPQNTKMAIAYMQSGRAVLGSQLSSDPAQVLHALRMPGGVPDESASPYFCLSDLAKNWPSNDRSARRIAVLISDGIDYYNLRYDPEDPYVQAAINDSVRNGLVVYFLFWHDAGRISRSGWEQNAGQSLMLEVTQATGGNSYWEGFGNPVSFQPYLQDLRNRLANQWGLSFAAPLSGKGGAQIERLDFKMSVPAAKVSAPQKVLVEPAGAAQQ